MSKFELLKFLGRGRSREVIPVLDRTAQIEQIAINASKIWFDRKGNSENKIRRYREAAEKLLPLLTSKLLEDPDFYRRLGLDVNMRVLQLLSELVPKQKSEEFQSSSEHRVIAGYLNDLGKHNGLIPFEQNGGDSTSMHSDSAVRLLRSRSTMPQYLLDDIFEENIGLPPKRDRPGVPLEKKYEDVVRAPGEQRQVNR